MDLTTVELEVKGQILNVWLNRPDVHNAFDTALITELSGLFLALRDMAEVRVVVLGGRGASFCAGADVNMMRRIGGLTLDENRQDAMTLAGLFHAVNTVPQPVVGRVHGACLGGGTGLAACCDFVAAEAGCRFGFTEVKLGILPAVISPFVVSKIGGSAARAHFSTGARFDAAEALRIGLVHSVASGAEALDAEVARVTGEYLTAAPGAVARVKQLVRDLDVPRLLSSEEILNHTAELITERRASDEGREGLSAFLERRRPNWAPKQES